MTPPRRRMIEELQAPQYAIGTQKSYLHCIARFDQHFDRSPERLEKISRHDGSIGLRPALPLHGHPAQALGTPGNPVSRVLPARRGTPAARPRIHNSHVVFRSNHDTSSGCLVERST